MNVTVAKGIIRIELLFTELLDIAMQSEADHLKPSGFVAEKSTAARRKRQRRHAKPQTKALRVGRAGKNAPIQQRILTALSTKGWKRAQQLRAEIKATASGFHDARAALEQAGRVERRGEFIKTEYRLTSVATAPTRVPLSKSRAVRSGNTGRGRRSR